MPGVLVAPLALIGCFCALLFSQLHHEDRPPPDTPLAAYVPRPEPIDAAPNVPIPDPTPIPTPEPAYVAPPPPPAPRATAARRAPTAPPQRATPVAVPIPEPPVTAHRAGVYDIVAAYFPEQADRAYRVTVCESGAVPSTNTGNGYYGMWQFDAATWASVGGTGLASNASAEEQTMRARMLYDRRGWQPWGCA